MDCRTLICKMTQQSNMRHQFHNSARRNGWWTDWHDKLTCYEGYWASPFIKRTCKWTINNKYLCSTHFKRILHFNCSPWHFRIYKAIYCTLGDCIAELHYIKLVLHFRTKETWLLKTSSCNAVSTIDLPVNAFVTNYIHYQWVCARYNAKHHRRSLPKGLITGPTHPCSRSLITARVMHIPFWWR